MKMKYNTILLLFNFREFIKISLTCSSNKCYSTRAVIIKTSICRKKPKIYRKSCSCGSSTRLIGSACKKGSSVLENIFFYNLIKFPNVPIVKQDEIFLWTDYYYLPAIPLQLPLFCHLWKIYFRARFAPIAKQADFHGFRKHLNSPVQLYIFA